MGVLGQETCFCEDRGLEGKEGESDGRRESKDESCSGGGITDVRNLIFVFRVPWNLKIDIFRAVEAARKSAITGLFRIRA